MTSLILGFAFDFLAKRFDASIPGDALKVVTPILADLIDGSVRLTDETSLELQARLDRALRSIGYEGV